MLTLLTRHGQSTSRDYTQGLVNSQVVPSYDDVALPGVAEYRALMEKHNPQIPEALRDVKHSPERLSFRSLEGFVNAKVIVEPDATLTPGAVLASSPSTYLTTWIAGAGATMSSR